MAETTTWKIIGKPKEKIRFTENIFPIFTSTLKAEDNYGTWTCSGTGWNNNNYVYKFLDHSTSTGGRHGSDSTVANRYAYVYINLPETIEMIVEEFSVVNKMWGGYFKGFFQGYNQETNEWETITEVKGMTYNKVGTVVFPTTVKKYYKKFRAGFYNSQTTPASSNYLDPYEIMATKGCIKVL